MWDQILGIFGHLQTINADTTKTFRVKNVTAYQDAREFAITGEEHRDQTLLTPLFELLGLVEKPVNIEAKLDDSGLRMTFVTDAGSSAMVLESELFVARKALSACVISITRPKTGIFIMLGLLTIFTIIGPLIAYILYKRQKHKISFGFDSSSEVGLMLSFTGDGSLQGKLLPLMAIGRDYLSRANDEALAVPELPTSFPALPVDPAGRDIECRIDGQKVYAVTKAELIQMAREGSLKRTDEVRKLGQLWVAAERVSGLFR